MAYTLHYEDGELGPGPSINGLRELKQFLSKVPTKHPALDMLLLHGATHLTKPLAIECRALAKVCIKADVVSTLNSLANDASKAKGSVVMAA